MYESSYSPAVSVEIGHASKHTLHVVSFSNAHTLTRNLRQVDCYAIHAASAIARVTSIRAQVGWIQVGFPLFANKIYGVLGNGPYTTCGKDI